MPHNTNICMCCVHANRCDYFFFVGLSFDQQYFFFFFVVLTNYCLLELQVVIQANEYHVSRYQMLLKVCELARTTVQQCEKSTLGNSTPCIHCRAGPIRVTLLFHNVLHYGSERVEGPRLLYDAWYMIQQHREIRRSYQVRSTYV